MDSSITSEPAGFIIIAKKCYLLQIEDHGSAEILWHGPQGALTNFAALNESKNRFIVANKDPNRDCLIGILNSTSVLGFWIKM